MANHLSNYFHFLVLVIIIVQLLVEGDAACSELVGRCDSNKDCNEGCKSLHNGNGLGICNYNLCTCVYNCEHPPTSVKKCLAGNFGLCDAQCNFTCAGQFNQGQGKGFCSLWYGKKLCICQYNC